MKYTKIYLNFKEVSDVTIDVIIDGHFCSNISNIPQKSQQMDKMRAN